MILRFLAYGNCGADKGRHRRGAIKHSNNPNPVNLVNYVSKKQLC